MNICHTWGKVREDTCIRLFLVILSGDTGLQGHFQILHIFLLVFLFSMQMYYSLMIFFFFQFSVGKHHHACHLCNFLKKTCCLATGFLQPHPTDQHVASCLQSIKATAVTSAGRTSWSSIPPAWSYRYQTSGSSDCSGPTAAEAGPAALGVAVGPPAGPGASGCTSGRAAWGVPSENSNGRKMSLLQPPNEGSTAFGCPLKSPHSRPVTSKRC